MLRTVQSVEIQISAGTTRSILDRIVFSLPIDNIDYLKVINLLYLVSVQGENFPHRPHHLLSKGYGGNAF